MSGDKFDNIPRIVLEKEDRESFQRVRNNKASSPSPEPMPSEAPKSSGGGVWLFFTFLIALGGYGASYYLWDIGQKQSAALNEAEERILELERKLSATGEELDQSAVALRVQVTELKDKTDVLWEEMDKLWASAWRRNQTEIKDLAERVNKNNRESKQQYASLESDVSVTGTNVAVLQEQIETQLVKAQELNQSIETVVRNSASSSQEMRNLSDQIATSALRIEALAERLNELEELKTRVDSLSRRPVPRPVTPPPTTTNTTDPQTQNQPQTQGN